MFTTVCQLCIYWATLIQYTSSDPFLLQKLFNIILSTMHNPSKWRFSFRFLKQETVYISSSPLRDVDWDSAVGITTGYELDGPGIESRWRQIFRTCPDWPRAPSSLVYNEYRVFSSCKERPGSCCWPLTPIPLPRLRNSRAIPLLPLWAVRPVQSLSACTRVHFTLSLPMRATCSTHPP